MGRFWLINTVQFEIKSPTTDDDFERYFQLRWKLLRAPWQQPRGSEIDDIEDQCYHLIAIHSDEVIGVSRLQFNSSEQAQIRYMAVDERYRSNGIGRALINALESHAREQRVSTILLDARQNAVGFYESLGYKVIKPSYLLFDDIQHFQMNKTL